MRLFLLIFIFILPSFAIDFVDIYRKEGLSALQKELERHLLEESYWRSYLEKRDTRYGYYESIHHLIITDKSTPSLTHYRIKKDGITPQSESKAIVGSVPGDKQVEGDLKTPIGVYDLTARLGDLAPKYGPLAFNTSYPNVHDKTRGKNGHGIWIHGLPEDNPEKPETQGCVAVNNDYLIQLSNEINHKNSLLIIGESTLPEVNKEDLALILSTLFQWKKAWKESDIDTYLSYYDPEFKRFDGQGIQAFSRYKKRIFSRRQKKQIDFSDINIAPYPNSYEKNMYRVDFFERYHTRTYQFEGKKELYVHVDGGKVRILTEK